MTQIIITEAVTSSDKELFWQRLHEYFKRDVLVDADENELEYFLGDEYKSRIEEVNRRKVDRGYYLLMHRGDDVIGIALTVIYFSEDSKCFVNEFCVFPEYRGGGVGSECARAFLDWGRAMGADYFELNCDDERRQRFWKRLGFIMNGLDEWGMELMILPPQNDACITVEVLSDSKDGQFIKLINGFKNEVGEGGITEDESNRLSQAIDDGSIVYFIAKRGYRAVGMCSVATVFSSFKCCKVGIFEDFYIEPVFRKRGITRKLVSSAMDYCGANGVASLSVTCAPCDIEMYSALGFDYRLGESFSHVIE